MAKMKDYTVRIDVSFQARDEAEAALIVAQLKAAVQVFEVDVDVDDPEEA